MHMERYCSVLPIAGESERRPAVPIELGSMMLLPHVRQENAKAGGEGGGGGAGTENPSWSAGIVAAQEAKAREEQKPPAKLAKSKFSRRSI